MPCKVEFTDEFGRWWESLSEDEPDSVDYYVRLLEEHAAALKYPYSSGVEGSRFAHMRELRVQHAGRPYRVLYAFDPRRMAVLLIGGDKTGNDRWYEENVPRADDIYEAYIQELKREGLI
jgi:hypothetical protein